MAQLTREKMIEEAKKASKLQDTPLSRSDFQRLTGISSNQIYRLFPTGGWGELKQKANLDPHPNIKTKLTDNDLLEEFHSVVLRLAKIPTWSVFSSMANISSDVIRRRFGGTQGVLSHYRDWLLINYPTSGILEQLKTQSKHEFPLPPEKSQLQSKKSLSWNKNSNTEYGQPLDFRGLRHAPINEQGVIFLFAMISYEIGFIIEAIHASFPDCEGKRCIDRNKNRWQRVSIEFEFQSSSFKSHGHDPEKCDLIICWEHDWTECPIEVMELRSIINQLDK